MIEDIADFPGGDPLAQLQTDEQKFRARIALDWLVKHISPQGVVVKLAALRCLLGRESEPMEKVARRLHVSRAAISKQCTRLADSLGLPGLRSRTGREIYRRAALKAWEKRKAKVHGDDGQI